MATYNGEVFLREQIDSILPQLSFDDELIISDDKSNDTTVAIINEFKDNRIKLIFNQNKKVKRAHPAISNFENALKHAKGDYIFLSDQDDIWKPNKISLTIEYIKKYDLVLSDCELIDKNGILLYNSFFELNQSKKGLFYNLKKNSYIGCCMAFKRELLKIILPFPKDIPLHDVWIGFVAELKFKPYFLNEKLICYRRHDNVTSFTGGQSKYGILKKISFRFNCLKYIPLIILRKHV